MNRLNDDVLLYITSFLSPYDFYAYFETCKLFYNLKSKVQNLQIKNPPSWIISKSIKMIEWASLHPEFKLTKNISRFAVKNDDSNIINYLIYNDCPFNYKSYIEAIRNENINLIMFLKENDVEINNSVYLNAAKIGNLEILKLFKKNINFNSRILNFSISGCNFDSVKWFIKNGCRPNHLSLIYAVKSRNFRILEYIYNICLHDLSLPLWNNNISVIAAQKGYIDILKWLNKKYCPMNVNTTNAAYKYNKIKTLKWLVNNGCPIKREVYNNLQKILNFENNIKIV
jgi:hypothetical protein